MLFCLWVQAKHFPKLYIFRIADGIAAVRAIYERAAAVSPLEYSQLFPAGEAEGQPGPVTAGADNAKFCVFQNIKLY